MARETSHANASAKSFVRSRTLIGFFNKEEGAAHLTSINAFAGDMDPAALDRACDDARGYVATLGARPASQIVPVENHPHLALLEAEPTFVEHRKPPHRIRIARVGVGNLVACQPNVDWDFVESLAPQVPAVGDEAGLLRFCLPLQREVPAPRAEVSFSSVTNTGSWFVDNPDVRFCGLVQGDQNAVARSFVGFSVGAGLQQMSVLSCNGRHMLNNGYHRAVALARAGHDLVPTLFVEVPPADLTPPVRYRTFSPQIVFGASPPLIADFLGRAAVVVPTKRLRFLFTVHADRYPIPT